MDHMLAGVLCTSDADGFAEKTMQLQFTSEDALEEALTSWSELSSFAIVTSHSTCNPVDERGAWL